MNKLKKLNLKGISLIVLVITIIIMVILATAVVLAVTKSGIIDNAKESKFKSDMRNLQAQLADFTSKKSAESMGTFEISSLNANAKSIYYNTKAENSKEKDISAIFNEDIFDKYKGIVRIYKGQLLVEPVKIGAEEPKERDWAENIGILTNEFGIINGVLNSSDFALSMIDSNGKLELPNYVREIRQGAFASVSGLKEIVIPGTVQKIGAYVFSGNTSLSKVTIKEGTRVIGSHAFRGCTALTEIELPESITNYGYAMFQNCNRLASVKLNATANIASNMFQNCTSIASITIPKGVKVINEYAFSGCTGLTNITMSESIESIMRYTFNGCTNLNNLELPKALTTIGEYAFNGCAALTNVTVNESNTNMQIENGILYGLSDGVKSKIHMIFETALGSSTELNIAEGIRGISNTSLGSFKNKITKIVFPSTFTDAINGRFFSGMTALSQIEVNSSNTVYSFVNDGLYYNNKLVVYTGDSTNLGTDSFKSGISSVSEFAFSLKGANIATITMPNTITSLNEYAFNGCSNMTSINLSTGLTSLPRWAFNGCSKLTKMVLPDSITTLNAYPFNGCSGIKSIRIGPQVTSIHALVAYNSGITNIEVDANNANYKFEAPLLLSKNGTTVVATAGNPSSITVPNGVTTIITYAFYYRTNLSNISLPEGMTTINNAAFEGCNKLKEITIPSSMTDIHHSAFIGIPIERIMIKQRKDESSLVESASYGFGALYGSRVVEWII